MRAVTTELRRVGGGQRKERKGIKVLGRRRDSGGDIDGGALKGLSRRDD